MDDDRGMEEIGFFPSAVGEPLEPSTCATRCATKWASGFFDLAAIVTEEGDTPRDCYDCRL